MSTAAPPAGRPRRSVVLLLALTLVVALPTSVFVSSPRPAAAADATTTSSLNLRSGPGTEFGVILVMPAGATVTLVGGSANGFLEVTYNDTAGWASATYLDTGGGSGSGTAVVTSSLNLRAGPSTGDAVLTVMPAGATVTLTGESTNGFLSISYNGLDGWAFAAYLDTGGGAPPPDPDPGTGGTATVTSNLNLRAGPSTGDRVLTVMPAGATVTLTGQSSNGFLSVSYNGTNGWAFADYLDTDGGAPPPDPDPDPGSGETATVTSNLNLRSGPGTNYSVITVMPAGATVTLAGGSSNGFLEVTYNGTGGWASATYLDTDGGAPPPDPDPDPSGSAVTTTGLNLRAGPSLGDAVILVMPAGATVTITGSSQNGFYPVSYGGQSGWAFGDYLDFDGDPGPPPSGGSGIVWPFASGTSWRFIQGYNGGTHQDEDYYAFDIARTSGSTAGQAIYAPVSGTVVWNDPNSGGLLIDMGNGYGVAMYHVTFLSSLSRGDVVTQGDYLGTISAPGGPGYAVTPHVHLALYNISGGGRSAAPFTGSNAISGRSFPDTGGGNQYGGTVINV